MISPSDIISIFSIIEKGHHFFLFFWQTLIIFFLVCFCKKILGNRSEKNVHYLSCVTPRFHLTEPNTIIYSIQIVINFTILHKYIYLP